MPKSRLIINNKKTVLLRINEPDGKHALIGESIIVMIVKSSGHSKVADFDGFVSGHETISAGNVAMNEADFVEVFQATSHVQTHLRQSGGVYFFRGCATAFVVAVSCKNR